MKKENNKPNISINNSDSIPGRRNFLQKASSLGLGLGLAGLGGIAALGGMSTIASCSGNTSSSGVSTGGVRKKKKLKWKLTMAVSKTLPIWGDSIINFAKYVSALSDGELNIKVYGANEIIPGLGVFDSVKSGDIEMGHAAAYYWQGKIPSAVFFTTVPFGLSTEGINAWLNGGDGISLWEELYAPHNLQPIPCGNTGMQMGGWFRKPINSIEDFKGLKMRMPGLGGKVIARLGASAETIAAPEIYQALSTGVIDATEWVGPYHDYIMGFPKITKYYYANGWHEPGTALELIINKEKWDSLSPKLQMIVRIAAAATDREMSSQWVYKDSEYYARIIREGKVKVQPFPKSVLVRLKKEAKIVLDEVKNTSPLATKIYNNYFAFKKRYDAYRNMNLVSYLDAIR